MDIWNWVDGRVIAIGKKGQGNEHGSKAEVGRKTLSCGGKVKDLRSHNVRKFIRVDIEITWIMREGMLKSVTVTQGHAEMTTIKSDISIF